MDADRLPHMGALVFGAEILVLDPFEAVAGDLPSRLLHRFDLIGRTQKCRRNPIDGERQIAGGEEPPQTPEARAGAIFINRFHVPMALAGPGLSADDLGEKRLRSSIAMENAVLAALLVIEHEL